LAAAAPNRERNVSATITAEFRRSVTFTERNTAPPLGAHRRRLCLKVRSSSRRRSARIVAGCV
jgi:hypothetical protein